MSKSVSENVYLDTNCAWSENRSGCCILLFCILPYSVAALECSQVKQQLHNKTKQQTDGLTECLSLSLPVSLSVCLTVYLSAPFCIHFHIENHSSGRPTTRGRVACVLCGNFYSSEDKSRIQIDRRVHESRIMSAGESANAC